MKKYLSAAIMATLALSAYAEGNAEKSDTIGGFKFTDVKVNKTTPVKDQNKSGTCWSFSGIGFIEDELLRTTGKEYDLSEMFIVRHCYSDKADKYIRTDGTVNFAQGGSTLDPCPTVDISKFSTLFSFPRHFSRLKVCISHFP